MQKIISKVLKSLHSLLRKQSTGQAALFTHQPIVIMGRGHSGTRIFSSICENLGINMGVYENTVTGDVQNRKFQKKITEIALKSFSNDDKFVYKKECVKKFENALIQYYYSLGKPKSMWGWKFPETYMIVPYVFELLPQAKYIHVIRDGRDISFKKHLTDDPQKKLGKKILTTMNALYLPHHHQAALSWEFQLNHFGYWGEKYNSVDIIDIRFEDICTKPFEVVKGITKFLGINLNEKTVSYLKNEINHKKINQYLDNDCTEINEVEDLIHQTLKKYRYI